MSLLTRVLERPAWLDELSEAQWDEILRLARYANLLGCLYALVEERDMLGEIPAVALDVLSSAHIRIEHMQLMAKRELANLDRLFAGVDYPVVLLKGSAYLAAGLPPAKGRRLNDIDILVPHHHLAEVERLLNDGEWRCDQNLADYDDRYYREWSHELPPMRHPDSRVELDVHHNLLQPTSRIKLDAEQFFAELVPLEGTVFSTLSTTDLVLHSATHLFMSDELRGGLRDLVDMHRLCTHFAAREGDYWQRLAGRAQHLGLLRPLYYAADTMRRHLSTSIPDSAWRVIALGRPNWLVERVMRQAINSHVEPDNIDRMRSVSAERLLYLRSHWIRMPPLMLARHLAYKWLRNFSGEAEKNRLQ